MADFSELSELDTKIFEAFDLFDHERNKTIDTRELGTVIRSLGCSPSEVELDGIITSLENVPPNGYINYEVFLPLMGQILIENRYLPVPEEEIVNAFLALDSEKTGIISPETLEDQLMKQGEKFSRDEMDEMLASAVDIQKGGINYREFAITLASQAKVE